MRKTIIKQATVYPITSLPVVTDVAIQEGKIVAIGNNLDEKDATIINGKGQYLFPGFIDVHTHLGLYDEGTGWAGNDANETIEAMTPHIRSMDGIHPLDGGFRDAISSGITCAHVMPGSANVIGGTTCVIKTHGKNIEKMILKQTAGLKIALGENPKRMHSSGNQDSITRMGIMGMLREKFLEVKHDIEENQKKLPRYKAISDVIGRKYPVRIHAHRADDILSAIRFSEEFKLDYRIEHCTEGHLIVDELPPGIQVSVGPTMTRRSKIELRNKSWSVYRALVERGIQVSITTDHPYIPIQYLNVAASLAVREGLNEEDALKGITINPALNLGVDNRVGSIEIGKDADLVLWNEHPFHYMAKPTFTMINGEIVYEK